MTTLNYKSQYEILNKLNKSMDDLLSMPLSTSPISTTMIHDYMTQVEVITERRFTIVPVSWN